jgi:hypothetical protein
MIQMSVRQNYRVDALGRHGEGSPIARPKFPRTLEEPAVDKESAIFGLHQRFGAGDGTNTTKKGKEHALSSTPIASC